MVESLRAGLTAFFAFIPQLLGAIIILIVGYIMAGTQCPWFPAFCRP